jgi:hypothetical protein
MSVTSKALKLFTLVGAAAVLAVPLVTSAAASTIESEASTAAVTTATARSTETFGLLYRGGRGDNHTTIRLAGQHFIITDTEPIIAEEGCVLINPGVKPFTVQCRAFKVGGGFRQFEVRGQIGNDIITNSSAVSMKADGGEGNDVINGGSAGDDLSDIEGSDKLFGNLGNDTISTATLNTDNLQDVLDGGGGRDVLRAGAGPDILRGGSGSNDQLDGGLGADLLDGGTGSADSVTYQKRTHRVVASIRDNTDSVGNGEFDENDIITSSVEDLVGGSGPDVLVGNESANRLSGMDNVDRLLGNGGADRIEGGAGADFLYANSFVSDPHDGSIDDLDGGIDIDFCRIGVNDPDRTTNCESIDVT